MKDVWLTCVIGIGLGAVIASWQLRFPPTSHVAAQEPVSRAQVRGGATNKPPEVAPFVAQRAAAPASDVAASDLSEFTPEERINIRVYEKVNRGVVHITTKVYTQEMFFSFEGPADGSGSGSVIDKNGHILTNYHVIEGATSVKVTLFNGETFEAGLVGQDPLNDVAVLRISVPQELLFPIEFGDSAKLRVGQRVLAIGNPFGLERTLTVGTLSSLNRRLPSRAAGREIKSVIQIDAALNQGNSGGPLLNSHGLLIGMNTAIASQTGQNTGVGFAVPVNTIRRLVPQLLEHGRVVRPVIGIESVFEAENGLQIIRVTPGGPAHRAGLRGFRLVRKRENVGRFTVEREFLDRSSADTIRAVNGQLVKSGDDLLDVIESKLPGDSVELTILRDGTELAVTVILGASD